MSDYPERLRNFNRAGQLQYEWFNEVADHIEGLEAKLKEASPNQVRPSRVLDAEKLDALLAELRDTLAELKGQ